jgi:hypothetical protein
MSRISKATIIKSVDYRGESFSLGYLDSDLLEQPMEEPWDLAMLVKKLNSSNWFCEVEEA